MCFSGHYAKIDHDHGMVAFMAKAKQDSYVVQTYKASLKVSIVS